MKRTPQMTTTRLAAPALAVMVALSTVHAQAQDDGTEALQLVAIEALMVAPSERALPVVQRLLAGDSSDELKSRALFVLGQIDLPEAEQTLLEYAQNSDGELQLEAIRSIGINGDPALTAQLADVYSAGDMAVREAVLEAYMIAGDKESVFAIATNAGSDEEFEAAVQQLGVMGATDMLQQLRDRPGAMESLIDAYAIAGDTETLLVMARDGSDPLRQKAALQGLGIAGGDNISEAFREIYLDTDDPGIREAVRNGILIADDEELALDLFRSAGNDQEKAELLRLLVIMDSDAAMEAIDAALGGGDNGVQP
ncbi:HEAT repeat domain-containing protein [Marinihelvus fidelis]|nr:HEAT repeat domain-containing protein [Marinihelvus fidelis]